VSKDMTLNDAKLTIQNLRTILDNVGAFVYAKDLDGRYTFVNEMVQTLFGLPLEEILGQTDDQFFDLTASNDLLINDRLVLNQGQRVEAEENNVNAKTGEKRTYWSVKIPLRSSLGDIIGMCGISTDITERRKTEEHERFRTTILEMVAGDHPLHTILEATVRGVERCNPDMLCSILLLDEEGRHLINGVAPSLPEFYNTAINGVEIGESVGSCGTAAYSGHRVIVEDIETHPYWQLYKDLAIQANLRSCWSQPILSPTAKVLGTFAIYHHQPSTPSDADINLIEQTAHLISIAIERRTMENQIRQLAFYDPLTCLPNRRLFNDRLSQCLAACKRNGLFAALMFIDLDRFKSLNDIYGHEAGDLLLIEAAARLRGCVRETDTVARFGGDEFVVLISDLSADEANSTAQAALIAEKIRKTLAEIYTLTINPPDTPDVTITHHCTASIGVVVFANHDGNQNDILNWCDAAMYKAKESGRNLVQFYEPHPIAQPF